MIYLLIGFVVTDHVGEGLIHSCFFELKGCCIIQETSVYGDI